MSMASEAPAPSRSRGPGSTETRLIDAAERLFAEEGFGSVSLRAVMQAAGTNVAAVHYHFGSKQALLDAVLRSRLEQVATAREALLADVTDRADARDLARALVDPVARVLESGGEHWVRLVGQLLATDRQSLGPVADSFLERNSAFVDLLARLSPEVPEKTLHFRLTQAMRLTLGVLGDIERTRTLLSSDGGEWSTEEVVANLMDVVTAVLAGPGPSNDGDPDDRTPKGPIRHGR